MGEALQSRAAGSDSAALAAAYAHCWHLATTHYENFTVGSWLLPRRLRKPLAAIYAFARTADDFADEGERPAEARLADLDEWDAQLQACYADRAVHPVFVALADTVRRFAIPMDPFRRLLDAFRQDARFQPFETFDDLRDYCRRSADPVGHLVLALFGYHDAERQALADRICTGLQLANFWQDITVDAAKGRVYVPIEDLRRFGCTLEDVRRGEPRDALCALVRFQVERTRAWLREGLGLAARVEPRLAREVRLFGWGGLAILAGIEAMDFDVFTTRPTVRASEKTRLIARALVGLPAPPYLVARTAPEEAVRDAYAYCQAITRRSSSNFYYAFRLLPAERRQALFAVYAFCRFVDDIADDAGRRDPQGLLARWREELGRVYQGTATHPIGIALADATRRFPIAREHCLDLIRGVELDLSRRRYETFEQLYEYCYLVASTVGLMCIEIFGYQRPSARDYAVDLGVAFQLTNILRDVMEDAARDRIYLPLADLERFGCQESDLLSGRFSQQVGALMAFECGRAHTYYDRASAALAPEDRSSLAAAEAMRLIYERLLGRIEARHFNVFGPKVTLPRYEKVTLALSAWGRAQLAVRHS
ncbi:MAG: squalene synthase HpnC [Candidatus Binatia bacterium]